MKYCNPSQLNLFINSRLIDFLVYPSNHSTHRALRSCWWLLDAWKRQKTSTLPPINDFKLSGKLWLFDKVMKPSWICQIKESQIAWLSKFLYSRGIVMMHLDPLLGCLFAFLFSHQKNVLKHRDYELGNINPTTVTNFGCPASLTHPHDNLTFWDVEGVYIMA